MSPEQTVSVIAISAGFLTAGLNFVTALVGRSSTKLVNSTAKKSADTLDQAVTLFGAQMQGQQKTIDTLIKKITG